MGQAGMYCGSHGNDQNAHTNALVVAKTGNPHTARRRSDPASKPLAHPDDRDGSSRGQPELLVQTWLIVVRTTPRSEAPRPAASPAAPAVSPSGRVVVTALA